MGREVEVHGRARVSKQTRGSQTTEGRMPRYWCWQDEGNTSQDAGVPLISSINPSGGSGPIGDWGPVLNYLAQFL